MPRRFAVIPLASERRLRYQDWVAGRRRLVRELSGGRLGYLHVPDMMGEGWAHFHRDLRAEMARDALIVDVRGNRGGHVSELVVEKLARRVMGWDMPRGCGRDLPAGRAARAGGRAGRRVRRLGRGHGHRRDPHPRPRPGGRRPHLGRRDRHRRPSRLVDGTPITVPRYAIWLEGYGWGVENHGVDPDVEVLITPNDAAAGRDPQLETAVRLALDALDKQPPPAPPEVATGPVKSRRPLSPRPAQPGSVTLGASHGSGA